MRWQTAWRQRSRAPRSAGLKVFIDLLQPVVGRRARNVILGWIPLGTAQSSLRWPANSWSIASWVPCWRFRDSPTSLPKRVHAEFSYRRVRETDISTLFVDTPTKARSIRWRPSNYHQTMIKLLHAANPDNPSGGPLPVIVESGMGSVGISEFREYFEVTVEIPTASRLGLCWTAPPSL